MKYTLRIFTSLIAIACFTITTAQEYRGIIFSRKQIPATGQAEELLEYAYRQKQSDLLPKTILKLDSVSTEEMKEMFFKYHSIQPKAAQCQGNDSTIGLYEGNLLDSPLRNDNKTKAYRGIWSSLIGLRLVKLISSDGTADSIAYKKLMKKLGGKDREITFQKFLPKGNGTAIILNNPLWYMGQLVSANPLIYHYIGGRLTYSYLGSAKPDYFSYIGIKSFGMPEWYSHIQAGMLLLGNELTAKSLYRLPKRECSFTFLMRLHDNGGYSLELLLPEEPDKDVKSAFAFLQKLVHDKLTPGLFNVLFTADKRIFPGRYISASFGPRGWYLRDLLPVE